ncbi:hypothetical protein ABI_09320 [Asticcacaulis biprosthecium C19]|uniref:DUF2125 domain-containing protein n=1 Tax=Asticcacaulis biprosthecium C19 TaxID=715226 RepID=F4QGP3_9CAUL|nr:DUF2125 domain-containing protein [Asticcacaulis biprosthecium]EGF92495.1 hypothetical protein ABI_09320 [Asticcacaulis biprosthecium C19]
MDDIALNRPVKKRSRIGLFAPLVIVLVLAASWTGYWFYVAHDVEKRISVHQALLVAQGYQATVDRQRVSGYPFRMYVDFDNITIIGPTGKGFAAKQLKAEANAYALDKWVLAAPQGLTLYRGRVNGVDFGKAEVTGRSLRASVSGLLKPVYHVAIEGVGLTMTPSDPTRPFAFTTADKFDAYLRPTPDVADSADFLVRVSGARGQPKSLIGDFSPEKPMNLHVEGTLNHYSAFNSGVRAWAAAGGTASAVKSQVTAGDLNLMLTSDGLTSNQAGHLTGKAHIEMKGTFNPIDVLGALRLISPENMTLAKPLLNLTLATQGTQKFDLDFRDGGAFIGPLKISDAPVLP